MIEKELIKTLAREVVTRQRTERVPEPELVMNDPEQVKSYRSAGLEDGVMAPVYLFHCSQVCEVIKEGDVVLDLACGPANQLGQIARINPNIQFKGIDLSKEMLTHAEDLVRQQKLQNVELIHGSITELSMLDDQSVDAIYSTMAIHHLPDTTHLKQMFNEINRVLKPDGGLYLVDFGRLKCEKSMNYFAHQYADQQPELFTIDYLNSLKAAFTVNDFKQNSSAISSRASIKHTFLVPYMVAFKSHIRRKYDDKIGNEIIKMKKQLPAYHADDLDNLVNFFKFGGLKSFYL